MVDAREQYIASRGPRKKRTHPARSAQALNTSGAGIVHRNMMDLQRQPNLSGSDIDRLKGLSRDWNRNRKYTDAGMALAGASTPQDAMKYYSDTTEDFRQLNKPAYGKMYPLTAGIMNIGEKGGILGAILSEIGKMGKEKGIPTIVDDTQEEQIKYVTDTFGSPNIHEDEFIDTESWTDDRKNVVIPPDYPIDEGDFTSLHPFDDSRREAAIMNQYPGKGIMEIPLGTPNVHDDEPWPYGDTEVIEETTKKDGNLISNELWDSIGDFDPTTIEGGGKLHAGEDITVPDWLLDPSIPMPAELTEGEYLPGQYHDELIEGPPPITRFDDSNREAGIATLYGKGPNWAKTGRRLEKEFIDYIQRTGDRITYEEFEGAWERLHALPRGLHFQEPRAGRR